MLQAMSNTVEVDVSDTRRTYFSFKYEIPLCSGSYCGKFLSLANVKPYMFKTDKSTVWQLQPLDEEIFLKLLESNYDTVQVDVKTSFLNEQSNKSFILCNWKNQAIYISRSLKLHKLRTNTCMCDSPRFTNAEVLCELFIYPNRSDDLKLLSKDFKYLLQDQNLSDVTLVINQREFQVHKAILSARSPVFNAMFRSGMKETKENKVVITDIEDEVMNQVLLYIYTGRINIRIVKNIAEKVIIAADKYDLERLKFICGIVLSSILTAENIFYNSSLAHRYQLDHLKKAVIKFISCSQSQILANIPDKPISSPDSSEKDENEVDLE